MFTFGVRIGLEAALDLQRFLNELDTVGHRQCFIIGSRRPAADKDGGVRRKPDHPLLSS
jgi:hypothetical protein